MLADGDYDVIVVDAGLDGDAVLLEVAVLAGPHKGEVVAIRAEGLAIDPVDCLGVPGTLTVADGAPDVRLEP